MDLMLVSSSIYFSGNANPLNVQKNKGEKNHALEKWPAISSDYP